MQEPFTRDRIIEALQDMPADATIDDVIERLVFLARIESGLAELDKSEGVPHDEAKSRFGLWCGLSGRNSRCATLPLSETTLPKILSDTLIWRLRESSPLSSNFYLFQNQEESFPERNWPEIRAVVVGHFRIVYRFRGTAIEVATVFRASREFPDRFWSL
jgi:plasmid stabilization system protein ParE